MGIFVTDTEISQTTAWICAWVDHVAAAASALEALRSGRVHADPDPELEAIPEMDPVKIVDDLIDVLYDLDRPVGYGPGTRGEVMDLVYEAKDFVDMVGILIRMEAGKV